jgi:hypothetical protein
MGTAVHNSIVLAGLKARGRSEFSRLASSLLYVAAADADDAQRMLRWQCGFRGLAARRAASAQELNDGTVMFWPRK